MEKRIICGQLVSGHRMRVEQLFERIVGCALATECREMERARDR